MAIKLSYILLAFLLSGCYTITQYPDQHTTLLSKSHLRSVQVFTQWHTSVDSITKACGYKVSMVYGCALSYGNEDRNICIIHAIEPKDFNDVPLLAILGHEFWHCLGARHG